MKQDRSQAWQKLTDYPQWVKYFPVLVRSEILSAQPNDRSLNLFSSSSGKRLHQVAEKAFLCFHARAEVYLTVLETPQRQVQFRLERGNFLDFSADLKLQDWADGTLMIYSVDATPILPIPSLILQEAMHLELPANLRKMRQVMSAK